MKYIDLRSDTVTRPTEAMRAAMAAADVGDDVYGDDPTVNKLQELAAGMAGKEAALFVPTGTMANQLAVMAHTRRGDDVICLRRSHLYEHECGGAAMLSGATLNLVDSEDGILRGHHVLEQIHDNGDIHLPPTTLVATENALATGQVVPLADAKELYDTAKSKNLKVHMDGARLFNAATALGVSAADIAAYTDSVMFCLSKGLAAPIGSVLCGPKDFIERALRWRKLLGGGMRQAGVLAAPGILALTEMTKRLGEDHENAAYLSSRLNAAPNIALNAPGIRINMVFFRLDADRALIESLPARMKEKGVLINSEDQGEFRFVTHCDLSRADIDRALDIFFEIIGA